MLIDQQIVFISIMYKDIRICLVSTPSTLISNGKDLNLGNILVSIIISDRDIRVFSIFSYF